MPTREKRLRMEENRRRREQAQSEEESPVDASEVPEVPEDDALGAEQLLPEGEDLVAAPAEPVQAEDALREMIQGLTPEQAALMRRMLGPAPPSAPPPEAPRPLAARPTTEPLWWVRFTIPGLGFFTYHGVNYDRGQLMPMVGGPRDEQLQRMGYVQPALKEEAHLRAQCGPCGLWFLTEQFRDMHGKLRHSDRFESDLDISGGMEGPDGGAAVRDVTGDAEERRMQQQYPLYLDRTRATLESGSG